MNHNDHPTDDLQLPRDRAPISGDEWPRHRAKAREARHARIRSRRRDRTRRDSK